jgi:hypothetical protein
LLASADRLVVSAGAPSLLTVAFESSAVDDIQSFRDSLVLAPVERGCDCFCSGTPKVELFASGSRLVEIRNLHTQEVRCSLWPIPVPLADRRKWVSWFQARHIEIDTRHLMRDRDRDLRPSAQFRRSAVAPPTLSQLKLPMEMSHRNCALVRDALNKLIPDEQERVYALLEWFGSGSGPWTGFPAWELIPDQLLLAYPLATIVEVIRTGPHSDALVEGAARLLASWSYQPRWTQQIAALPIDVKSMLWHHVMRSEDPDKRQKAAHAFRWSL